MARLLASYEDAHIMNGTGKRFLVVYLFSIFFLLLFLYLKIRKASLSLARPSIWRRLGRPSGVADPERKDRKWGVFPGDKKCKTLFLAVYFNV